MWSCILVLARKTKEEEEEEGRKKGQYLEIAFRIYFGQTNQGGPGRGSPGG